MRDCPHHEAFCAWHKEHLKSWGWARRTACLPQRTTPQISNQGHFLPRGGPIPGNRFCYKMGRAGDASRHDIRMVQSFGIG